MRFILASGSPRRQELLSLFNIPFDIHITATDETRFPGESPLDFVQRLSVEKAHAAAQKLKEGGLILAADTIVVDDRHVLGKPQDAQEAKAILQKLRGRVHYVYTAITLLETHTEHTITEVAASPVEMRAYSDAEIDLYVASGDPFDKAGAYAIQHEDFRPAHQFNHCYANVMGLPLCHLARIIQQFGVNLSTDIPTACQQFNSYDCPVYPQILQGEDDKRG